MSILFWVVLSPIIFITAIIAILLARFKLAELKILNSIKGPRRLPGTPFLAFFKNRFQRKEQVCTFLHKAHQQHGDIFHTFFVIRPVVVLANADLVQQLFTNYRTFQKGKTLANRFATAFVKRNVLHSNGDDWKRQRTLMNPAFYKLDIFVEHFAKEVDVALKIFDSGKPVNIADTMSKMTLDILGRTVFNHEFGYLNQKESSLLGAYKFMFQFFPNPKFTLFPFLLNFPLPEVKTADASIQKIEKFLDELISEAKERVAKKQAATCLLDTMVQSNENGENKDEEGNASYLSDAELKGNLNVLFIAGHETTATALSYALFNLAKYPEVQEKLHDEIITLFKPTQDVAMLTPENIEEAKYLNMFIKENMRMYPPIPFVPFREINKPQTVGEFHLPQGTHCIVPIYSIHHDERYWDEPEVFKPERFEDEKLKHSYSYLPFGRGPRTCIGNRFSLLEQKVFLIKLVQRYRVELVNSSQMIEFDPLPVILQPKEFQLVFKRRD